jgi:inner membrane protein
LGKKIGNKAALAGAVIATIPDLDVFLYLFYDKLDMLSIHRGLSHSILFSVFGAFIFAMVLSRIRGFRQINYIRLYVFSWLCLFTHILLDAFTAYGTQLFLPFSNMRVGLDSINVVDPLYTVPMMAGLILGLWIFRRKPGRSKFNNYGLLLSTVYLVFTLVNKQGVISSIEDRLAKEKIEYKALLTMPVGVANIHWYGVAKGRDSIYMLKYRMLSVADGPIEVFPIHEEYLDEIDEEAAEIMRWFAKGFYTVDKQNGRIRVYNLQVDMRGVVEDGAKKAPTVGYFELWKEGEETKYGSGSISE